MSSNLTPAVMTEIFQQPFFFTIAWAAVIFLIAVLFWLVIELRARWTKILGKKAPAEGKLLEDILRRVAGGEVKMGGLEGRVLELERIGRISIQKLGFLRFNPFSGTGGDQSFSLALLDGEGNGVVVSSLYTREGARIYAKEVHGGAPKQPLSEEEQQVLADAMSTNSRSV